MGQSLSVFSINLILICSCLRYFLRISGLQLLWTRMFNYCMFTLVTIFIFFIKWEWVVIWGFTFQKKRHSRITYDLFGSGSLACQSSINMKKREVEEDWRFPLHDVHFGGGGGEGLTFIKWEESKGYKYGDQAQGRERGDSIFPMIGDSLYS